MKIYASAVAILLASSFICAHPAYGAQDAQAISDWNASEAAKMAMARRDAARQGAAPAPGSVRIYHLDDFPAPAAVRESIAKSVETRKSGPMTVAADRIPVSKEVEKSVRGSQKNEAELRSSLTGIPASLVQTPLAHAELVGTKPSGAFNNGRWSGITRYFRVQGLGLIEFSEDDYVSAGTRLALAEEALDTEVNGTPAMSEAALSSDGRAKASLYWVTPERAYKLVLLADDSNHLQKGQRLLLDTASRMVEGF